MTDYVAYIRVSTEDQGRSGLGLEAQRAAIQRFLGESDRLIAPEFLEVESGKKNDRPELVKALAHARLTRSTLLVAKLDRLSRNVAFVATLLEAGVPVEACDRPGADIFRLHLEAVFAQEERQRISDRTKAALAAAKARGTKLGGYRGGPVVNHSEGLEARRSAALAFKEQVSPTIAAIRAEGVQSLHGIAKELNRRGVKTRRGGAWSAAQVARIG